jgi:acyl carrier protein
MFLVRFRQRVRGGVVMSEFVEPRVRRVVADHLGVEIEDLAPGVSLIDDLAADSLDLIELAVEIERQFGISLPEVLIDEIRTYGDIVDTVLRLTRAQREAEFRAAADTRPMQIHARVVPPPARPNEAPLQRAGWLTPYTAQTIAEDAITAGPGTRLELTVPAKLSDLVVTRLQQQFAWLGDRGVSVLVQRESAHGRSSRPRHHAA